MPDHILTPDGKWVTVNDDELCHKSHKYVKREKVNGKWRYWYEDAKDKIKDKLGYDEKEAMEKAAKDIQAAEAMSAEANKLYSAYTYALAKAIAERNALPDEFGIRDGVDAAIDIVNARQALTEYVRDTPKEKLDDKKVAKLREAISLAEFKAQLINDADNRENKRIYDAQQKVDKASTSSSTAQQKRQSAASKVSETRNKYSSAQKAYENTPLAKVEKATTKGKAFVDKLFSKKK